MTVSANYRSPITSAASTGIRQTTALAFAHGGIEVTLVTDAPVKLVKVGASPLPLGVSTQAPARGDRPLEVPPHLEAQTLGASDQFANPVHRGDRYPLPADRRKVQYCNFQSIIRRIQVVLSPMCLAAIGEILQVALSAADQALPYGGAGVSAQHYSPVQSELLAAEERVNRSSRSSIGPSRCKFCLRRLDTVQIHLRLLPC